MASVNYLGRIQIKQQHSCYTHTMFGRNSNNDVFIIPRIQHFNVFHSKHLTSKSGVSQNSQRLTVVTDNFITLFYGLVLHRYFIQSPANHQLIVTRLTRTWPTAGPKHSPRLFMARPAMIKTHVYSILKPRLHYQRYLYIRIVTCNGSPSNTKSPGPRPSSIPSDILMHAAAWPQ